MITIPTVVAVLVISAITQVAKKYIFPKYGSTGIQVFAFGLALLYVIATAIINANPSLLAIVEKAVGMLAGAIAVYEVLLSKIGADPVTKQL